MADREPHRAARHHAGGPRIDRDSFEPPYYQLANILRRQIATGRLRPGDSMRRLLVRDGEPVVYHRNFLLFEPSRPIAEVEMGVASLQGLFDGRARRCSSAAILASKPPCSPRTRPGG
jgi:hypothetical protein